MGEGKTALFPARDYVFLEVEGVSREYEHKRLAVLGQVLNGTCDMVVCSAQAMLQYTMPRALYGERTLSIGVGQRMDMQEITRRLVAMGYVSRPQVDGICQFSRRGGILDIFPPSYPNPVRLEFFDDEIDSLAAFDIDTQRRIDALKACTITPGAEVLMPDAQTMVEKLLEMQKSYKRKTLRAMSASARILSFCRQARRPREWTAICPCATRRNKPFWIILTRRFCL